MRIHLTKDDILDLIYTEAEDQFNDRLLSTQEEIDTSTYSIKWLKNGSAYVSVKSKPFDNDKPKVISNWHPSYEFTENL